LEWEVRPAGKKGEGVFAKKSISKYSIVILDGERPYDCPFFAALEPKNASVKQKMDLYGMEVNSVDGMQSVIYLRAAKFNHDCDANVSIVGDETQRVTVFVANRDIGPGEEILFTYMNLGYCPDFIVPPIPIYREASLRKRGIVCPSNCRCYDKDLLAKVAKAQRDWSVLSKIAQNEKLEMKCRAFHLLKQHYEFVTENNLAYYPEIFLFELTHRCCL
jgi:hypothetical protein